MIITSPKYYCDCLKRHDKLENDCREIIAKDKELLKIAKDKGNQKKVEYYEDKILKGKWKIIELRDNFYHEDTCRNSKKRKRGKRYVRCYY